VGRDPAFGRRLYQLRTERGLSLNRLGKIASFSPGFLSELEAATKGPSAETAARLDELLEAGGQLVALASSVRRPPQAPRVLPMEQIETLRRQVNETITSSGMSPAAVDDWEQTVREHGRATRYRPPAIHLDELYGDFAELGHQLKNRHSSFTLRRLTRVTAQLAGLMFLTLIKMNERDAARTWARTARVAAREAGDARVHSWVRAQEAYVHFYSDRYDEALTVAQHAQDLVDEAPCVGAVLAAALEARALGKMRRAEDARAAIGTAETILAHLDAEAVTASAFGYDEAQLRFHEGNALTHLHDSPAAWRAQQRALALYPDSDYLDRALVKLDRASCLTQDGDPAASLDYATDALASLNDAERQGLLTVRGREVFHQLPAAARNLPAGRAFHDLLMITAASEGNDS